MEKRTLDTVLRDIRKAIENREPIDPEEWVKSAYFLNIFKEDEINRLADLKFKVANFKLSILPQSKSVAEATIRVEATEDYRDMKKMEGLIEVIEEHIKITKIHARLANEQIRGN